MSLCSEFRVVMSATIPHKTMHGSSLPSVVCRRVHVLFAVCLQLFRIVVSTTYWLYSNTSRATGFTPGFLVGSMLLIFLVFCVVFFVLFVFVLCLVYPMLPVLCVCFVDCCLSFCPFSFSHCVVCSSSIYEYWLPLWYLQTLSFSGLSILDPHLQFSLTFIYSE